MTLLQEAIELVLNELENDIDDIVVERAVLGLFFSGVKLSTGNGGICFTPIKEIPQAVCCPSSAKAMPISGQLKGRKVKEYLNDISSNNILRRTLGIATLNALSLLVQERRKCLSYDILENVDAFDKLDLNLYKKIVVVGALTPMIKRLIEQKSDFKIIEQDSRTLTGKELEYYVPESKANLYIPKADLLIITGVTIINNTLPELLALAKNGSEILVTGPTASMLPEILFKHGVTMVGGIQVTNADELLDIISEGGSGYHFFEKYSKRVFIKRNDV